MWLVGVIIPQSHSGTDRSSESGESETHTQREQAAAGRAAAPPTMQHDTPAPVAGAAAAQRVWTLVSELRALDVPASMLQKAAARLTSGSRFAAPAAAHKLPVPLRSTPILFADEQPRRLCAARPPWGLLGDVTQLGASAKEWSRIRREDRTREHVELCIRFAERLLRTARNGTRPPMPHGQTCAIVGSGGGLVGTSSGRAIDAHDFVLRFNAAPAGGEWGADVGNKTSHRIFTDKTVTLRSRHASDKRAGGSGLLLYCMATWVGKCIHAGVQAGGKSPRSKQWLVNPVFVRQLRARLDESGGRGRLPSAGLVGISWALASCSKVSIYGFGNASEPNASATCGHYWDCKRKQTQYFGGKAGYHDWRAQWRVLSSWIEDTPGESLRFHPGSVDASTGPSPTRARGS